MELLKIILVFTLVTTMSAMPMSRRRHQDADISDRNWRQLWLDNMRLSLSSESTEESSEESSEETIDVTTLFTEATTTNTEDGSTLTPEPDTVPVDSTAATGTTPGNAATPADTTTSCDQCFTVTIPTAAPITDNRGDN